MPYGQQVLWPAHCVQNSKGAELAETLAVKGTEFKVRKGTNSEVDSYSAFLRLTANQKQFCRLAERPRNYGSFLCGLATDFCVSWSAFDAVKEGFKTFVLEDACRGIDVEVPLAAAKQQWKDKGIETISSNSLR